MLLVIVLTRLPIIVNNSNHSENHNNGNWIPGKEAKPGDVSPCFEKVLVDLTLLAQLIPDDFKVLTLLRLLRAAKFKAVMALALGFRA